jgi:hypothetical protein
VGVPELELSVKLGVVTNDVVSRENGPLALALR